MRATPGKKRKRTTDEGFGSSSHLSSQAKAAYASKSSQKGAVEVMETDEDGKYIKLHNTSTKVGWT